MNNCCANNTKRENRFNNKLVISSIITSVGFIPVVSTELTKEDKLGKSGAGCLLFVINIKVLPGVYAIGSLDKNSDIYVSVNYKLSFDILRKNLSGINGLDSCLGYKGNKCVIRRRKGNFRNR